MAASDPSPSEGQNGTSTANNARVWVGNLAYKSTEAELKEAFAGMKISEISLPERFGRRQGYAFITFDNEGDVEKALKEVNGKELLGREIKVQKATSGGPYTSENGEHAEAATGEGKKVRNKSRSKGTPRRTREATADEQVDASDAPTESKTSKQGAKPRRRRLQKKAGEEAAGSEEGETSGDKKKSVRKVERKGPPEDGTPSTTTIYVANIPFEYTDDKLKELFAAYNPASAYIVPRQLPRHIVRKLADRGETRKGRGFGFVTFADEAAQKKAVEEMNGHEVGSRAISVKVAIDKPKEENEGEEGAAPVATNGSAAS